MANLLVIAHALHMQSIPPHCPFNFFPDFVSASNLKAKVFGNISRSLKP